MVLVAGIHYKSLFLQFITQFTLQRSVVVIKFLMSFCLFQDELSMISEEDYTPLMEVFKPIFFSLIDVLLVKARHPPDADYVSWSLGKYNFFVNHT